MSMDFVARGLARSARNLQMRSAPNAFYTWLTNDFQVLVGNTPGSGRLVARASGTDANADASFIAYMRTRFAGEDNGNEVYVAPWGSDSNAGTMAAPFASLSQALRVSTATHVYLMGFGPRNPVPYCDYRASDPALGKLKIVRGIGGKQVIGTPGTDLSAATWTQVGTSGNYTAPVTAYPRRLLHGGSVDALGKAVPLRLFDTLVTLSGGGGSGAVVTAQTNVATGAITGFTVVNGGSGFTSAPTVTINPYTSSYASAGSGASATAAVSGGPVTGLTVTAGGTGYGSAASLTGNARAWPMTTTARSLCGWAAGTSRRRRASCARSTPGQAWAPSPTRGC